MKTDKRSGQEEKVCDFRLGHVRCLWNFQVQILDLEIRREILAKDRDSDVTRTEGTVKVMGMDDFAQLECR